MTDQALAELVLGCPQLLPGEIEGCDSAKGSAFVKAVSKMHPDLDQLDLQGCPDVTDASLATLAASCRNMHPDRLECALKGDMYLAAIAKTLPDLDSINLKDCHAVTSAGV